MIISYNASKPSCRPSPVMAHAGWMYQPLKCWCVGNEEFPLLVPVTQLLSVLHLFGDVLLFVHTEFDDSLCDAVNLSESTSELGRFDVAGIGVLHLPSDTELFMFADKGTVDDDFIICGGSVLIANDSSYKPSSFSNSFGSLAPGKSCLLANINMGTPCGAKENGARLVSISLEMAASLTGRRPMLNTYVIIWTFSGSHKFHFSLFHPLHIDRVDDEHNAICAPANEPNINRKPLDPCTEISTPKRAIDRLLPCVASPERP